MNGPRITDTKAVLVRFEDAAKLPPGVPRVEIDLSRIVSEKIDRLDGAMLPASQLRLLIELRVFSQEAGTRGVKAATPYIRSEHLEVAAAAAEFIASVGMPAAESAVPSIRAEMFHQDIRRRLIILKCWYALGCDSKPANDSIRQIVQSSSLLNDPRVDVRSHLLDLPFPTAEDRCLVLQCLFPDVVTSRDEKFVEKYLAAAAHAPLPESVYSWVFDRFSAAALNGKQASSYWKVLRQQPQQMLQVAQETEQGKQAVYAHLAQEQKLTQAEARFVGAEFVRRSMEGERLPLPAVSPEVYAHILERLNVRITRPFLDQYLALFYSPEQRRISALTRQVMENLEVCGYCSSPSLADALERMANTLIGPLLSLRMRSYAEAARAL